MPIELPSLVPENGEPTKPSLTLWFGTFVLCMIAGLAIGVIQAPSDPRQRDAGFWVQLFGTPALVSGVIYGFRRHYYDTRMALLEGEVEARQEDFRKTLAFARDPLAVIGWYYLTALGGSSDNERGSTASDIINGAVAITVQPPRLGTAPTYHSRIDLIDAYDGPGNIAWIGYRAAFESILDDMGAHINQLPRRSTLKVRLQLPEDVDGTRLLDLWNAAWRERLLPPADTGLIAAATGMMELDEWLDIPGGKDLECFTLYAAVQLHRASPEGSGEAVAAVLLSWAPLARRSGLKPLAYVHRPVQIADDIGAAMEMALLWGDVEPDEVKHLWDAGLTSAQQREILQWGNEVKLGIADKNGLSGLHRIQHALGKVGSASEWLGLALAVEHASGGDGTIAVANKEMILSAISERSKTEPANLN